MKHKSKHDGGLVWYEYLTISVETQLQKLGVWIQQLFYECSRQLGVYLLNNLHTNDSHDYTHLCSFLLVRTFLQKQS